MSMDTALLYFFIAIGGGFGALLRMFLADILDSSNGIQRRIPLGTLAANLIAAFSLGWLHSESALDLIGQRHLFFALTMGFSASASTFSAFAFQLAQMLKLKKYHDAFTYALISIFAGLLLTLAAMNL